MYIGCCNDIALSNLFHTDIVTTLKPVEIYVKDFDSSVIIYGFVVSTSNRSNFFGEKEINTTD